MRRGTNAAILSVLLAGFAATVFLSCPGHKPGPTDWSEFTTETVAGSLQTLARAEEDYFQQYVTAGPGPACQAALQRLQAHESVLKAGVNSDSTVWVFFKNGLLASIMTESRQVDSALMRHSQPAPAQVRITAGGEAAPSNVIIAPFTQELPGTEPGSIPDWLDFCCAADPVPGADVIRDAAVTPGRVRTVMEDGPGVLLWSGHGALVPSDTISNAPSVCALLTGESYADSAAAVDAVVNRYAEMLRSGNRYLAIVRHRPAWPRTIPARYYLAILPAFVTAYGNFDRYEGQPANMTKSLVWIDCCHSWLGMREAFRGKGADVFWGWDWATADDFAHDVEQLTMHLLTDTATAGEAWEQARASLGSESPPWRGQRAKYLLDGDSLCMVRAQMRLDVDGVSFHGYKVAVVMGAQLTVTACSTGTSSEPHCQVTVNFPSTGPGTWDCTVDQYALINFLDWETGRSYMVQSGYQGVTGTITITRCASDRVMGSFSGTLGRWTSSGHTPYHDPPDETIEITNGLIKFTGRHP
jgi:hypothetical protein